MIRVSLTLITLLLFGACATADKSPYGATPTRTPLSQRKATATVVTNSIPPLESPANQPPPSYQPVTQTTTPPPRARIVPVTARIASVNDRLRFVIVDFTNSRQPTIDERLSVYRVGEKVAEIKVSGPFRNTTVAADILTGEVKYGDEVKTQ